MMKCDKIEKAYKCIVEGSATDPADLLKSRLQCTSEDADTLTLGLVMLGMSADDIRKVAMLIEKCDRCRTASEVKETCEGWLDAWGDNDDLSLDDFKTFEELKIASLRNYRSSNSREVRSMVVSIKDFPHIAKIVKAMMMNLSIDIGETFMNDLYANLINDNLMISDVLESLIKRLYSTHIQSKNIRIIGLMLYKLSYASIDDAYKMKAIDAILDENLIKPIIHSEDYYYSISNALAKIGEFLKSKGIKDKNNIIESLLKECLEAAESATPRYYVYVEMIARRLSEFRKLIKR